MRTKPQNMLAADRNVLLAQAEEILDRAERENRDLTKLEKAELDSAIDQAEDSFRQDRVERVRKKISGQGNKGPGFGVIMNPAPNRNSGPNLLLPELQSFKGGGDREQAHRDALQAVEWMKATVFEDYEAKERLRSVMGQEWAATHTEGSGAKGGYLVPGPMYEGIIAAREQVGVSRQLARAYDMTSDTLVIPKRESGLTVYYPGESNEITESDAAFADLILSTKKRAILSYVSSELAADSAIPIIELLMQEMGHALALKEDQEAILGDGTSTYGGVNGLLNSLGSAGVHAAAGGNNTWAELTLNDFYGAMSKISDKYRIKDSMAWLCSAAFKWQVLDRLAAEVNGAGASQVVDGQMRDFFLGYPVHLSDRMPTATAVDTKCCLFGNFKHAMILGDRHTLRLDTDQSVAFTSDRIAIRAVTRYDILCHDMGDSSTAGAVVALKTAAS